MESPSRQAIINAAHRLGFARTVLDSLRKCDQEDTVHWQAKYSDRLAEFLKLLDAYAGDVTPYIAHNKL